MSVPKLRFKEFITEWKYLKLKEIAAKENKKNNGAEITLVLTNSATQGIINQSDYFDRDIANKNNLNGYYIVKNNSFIYNPRISNFAPVGPVKRNHLQTGVMSPLYTVFHFFGQVDLDFMEIYFNTNKWHFYLQSIANYGVRSDRMNISNEGFFNMPIKLPIIKEQEKIASFFMVIDQKLNLLKEKKEKLELYKKGMMQQIFSQKLRFKDEKGNEFPEWRKKKLDEITYKTDKKNKLNIQYPIYSVNNVKGFIPQSEQFVGLDSNERGYDISLYKIIENSTFAYNPARINVGSLGYYNGMQTVIVSSLYVCFKSREELNDHFLEHFFKTDYFNQQVLKKGEGGVRIYLFFENFSEIKISFPKSLGEQQKIADFLSALDTKINLVSTQIEKTELWKKGLLQQMFV